MKPYSTATAAITLMLLSTPGAFSFPERKLRGAVYLESDAKETSSAHDSSTVVEAYNSTQYVFGDEDPKDTGAALDEALVAVGQGRGFNVQAHRICVTMNGERPRHNPEWRVLETRQPQKDCSVACEGYRGCTGWEWHELTDQCFFFNTPNGGDMWHTTGGEWCAWRN